MISIAGQGQGAQGGYITVLHTHGRNGQYHPHLHLLATSGGYDGQGERWEHLQLLALRSPASQVAVAPVEHGAQDAGDGRDQPVGGYVFPEVSQRVW